ncbi:MAG TPA: glucose-1-phosphate adenylyltransferase [Verrucomicrobiota bacterium]|nr:glucose-1-phosphate adenylyltransferase [Verrucomicrobiales bacterium]HRI12337.1 glucose-1-phosphate adenylyltransferase [Verrucomicrobiota bacterium]
MPTARLAELRSRTLAVIMGGGQGTRLFPLTRERAKPAVPLAGKYRLVDIPISNCINSGIMRMYLLTQFNSASLHRHISQSFKFDHFGNGFVEILAAEQTFASNSWYQGTADAVRKNLMHIQTTDFSYALILSGDQLYRMDFRKIIEQHADSSADVTIATIPVIAKDASSLGILQINAERRIVRFVEKPKDPGTLNSLKLDRATYGPLGIQSDTDLFLASMGIYVFNRDVLLELLNNNLDDFGKHIIPGAIENKRVFSYVYQGYWEDIGTIRSFFEANLDQAANLPKFNFFDPPVFTRPRFLPASKVNAAALDHAVISDGCIISRARIKNSVIGIRSVLDEGALLTNVVMMGADYYDTTARSSRPENLGLPLGVGRGTRIENAIVDKNVRIGEGCVLTPEGKPPEVDHPLYYIRDGVLVIPKGTVIPPNTVI